MCKLIWLCVLLRINAWGYLVWLTNVFCCHGNGLSGINMCAKFHCHMYLYNIVMGYIACGYLTNMQGCHGNYSCGLYVCAEYCV